jgi:hypothetical protein
MSTGKAELLSANTEVSYVFFDSEDSNFDSDDSLHSTSSPPTKPNICLIISKIS